ncbi:MAG TPA: FAD-dependent oxidoreductase [Bryobacteraceae bacterium]|nr:FAD-dependent oxidoreductase [Bryobacteraceae bacterium]
MTFNAAFAAAEAVNPLVNPDIRRRFPDLHPAFTRQEAAVEANRCLYCADAPCAAACPTHIDVPKFIKKISSENLRGSALTILDANILGASCSRVCPVDVLCEGACVMHRFNREPIEIGKLQRFAMDAFYRAGASLPPTAVAPPRKLSVACIGAGPASLACAAELARRGHHAVVFEARKYSGGLNTYGVAEYKLRAAESLREVEFIQSLGVEIRSGEAVDTARLMQLAQEFDFVFLGLGTGRMEPLGVPGEGLSGVVDALRFIADYKTAQTIPIHGRVAIVGAGNTAIDAAVAAVRLGAERAIVVYRRTQGEMPAFGFEYEHAKQEGVDFCWSSRPVRIVGRDGRVAGVECVRVKPNLETIAGSEFTITCDVVIPAIGQLRASNLLAGFSGIDIRKGLIAVDRATGRTGNPKFYAGGDIVNGGREVVDAVADGKRAALAMIGPPDA